MGCIHKKTAMVDAGRRAPRLVTRFKLGPIGGRSSRGVQLRFTTRCMLALIRFIETNICVFDRMPFNCRLDSLNLS